MISTDTRTAILDRADIVTVVSEAGVKLKPAGRGFVACCPFHNEKTASFHVSPERGRWHCFGACGEGGNVIDFVMRHRTIGFADACKYLCERFGIAYDEEPETDAERENRLRREAIYGINERAAQFYRSLLHGDSPAAKAALSVAHQRWGKEHTEESGLGFAPGNGQELVQWARSHGENLTLMLEAGLIGRNENTGQLYDFYRDRLMIPIREGLGQHVVGFTARDLTGESKAKYVNSKESDAYHKSQIVFGVDVGRFEARRTGVWYCVEGAADAMKLHSVGILNCCATLGGNWTKQQLLLLKGIANGVCFINDADPPSRGERFGAGIGYVIRAGRLAMECGLTVSVRELSLGEGGVKQDPGSYFTDAHMMGTLEEMEYVTWYARKVWDKNANINRKAETIRDIADLAALVTDDTRLDMIVDELSKLNKGKERWRNVIFRARQAQKDAKRKKDVLDLRTYGFVEDKGCYYGLTDEGEEKWSNFTLQPLFHIRSSEDPRRLFEIKNNRGQALLLNLNLDDLNSLQRFRKSVESLGNYIWMAGESEMIKLKTYLYENTDTADVVRQMGWNAKGKFYAFSNGVYKDGEFHAADKFGIVRIPSESDDEQASDHCFFIPAGANTDVECFDDASEGSHALERNFKHRSLDTTSFGTYTAKFCEVWGDNGKIGLLYWLASLFRDIVMGHTMSFPILNLFGPKGTGKTTMGHQLMAFFAIDNKAPNLRGATPASLGYELAYSSNAMIHFDEYKNDEISPKTIELLKSTYDGVGRTKMGGADFKERVMSSVKSGVIMTGQEMPTADIALFHRCVFLMFVRDTFTDRERLMMEQLVEMQKYGCTLHVLEALDQRKRVEVGFPSAMRDMASRLRIAAGGNIETRIVENWAKLLAVFKCVEGKLAFPFTFDEVFRLSAKLCRQQNDLSGDSNELAQFWRAIMFLRDNGELVEDGDYKIRSMTRLHGEIVQDRHFDKPRTMLLLNTSRIFTLYKESARRSGDKPIPDNSLREYIKHSDCFVDYIKAARFVSIKNGYPERRPGADGRDTTVSRITRAMVLDYDVLKEKYGVSLDTSVGVSTADDDGGDYATTVSPVSELFRAAEEEDGKNVPF